MGLVKKGEFYIIGGDGKFYREVPREDGESDFVEAPRSLNLVEMPNGKFIEGPKGPPTLDDAAKGYLEGQTGHEAYFKSLEKNSKNDPREVRQDLKRKRALERKLETMAIDMVVPNNAMPNVQIIKDEKFIDLTEEYRRAEAAGHGKECDFQPVATYRNKLTTKSGHVVRPLYKGEVGVLGEGRVILCLEQGFGTGTSVQVQEALTDPTFVDQYAQEHLPKGEGES